MTRRHVPEGGFPAYAAPATGEGISSGNTYTGLFIGPFAGVSRIAYLAMDPRGVVPVRAESVRAIHSTEEVSDV